MRHIMVVTVSLFFSVVAMASEGSDVTGGSVLGLEAAIAIGLTALVGWVGKGKVGGSAVVRSSGHPRSQNIMFVPMLISLVLIKSIVIYTLGVAFQLVGKV